LPAAALRPDPGSARLGYCPDAGAYEHASALHEALERADPLPGLNEPDTRLTVPPKERLDSIALALLDALAERAPAQRVLLAALHTLPAVSGLGKRSIPDGALLGSDRVTAPSRSPL
jgi:hypothetical protein